MLRFGTDGPYLTRGNRDIIPPKLYAYNDKKKIEIFTLFMHVEICRYSTARVEQRAPAGFLCQDFRERFEGDRAGGCFRVQVGLLGLL